MLIIVLALLVLVPVLLVVNLYSWLRREETRKKRFSILLMNIIVGVFYLGWICYKVYKRKQVADEFDEDDGIGWIVLGVMMAELHGLILLVVMLVNIQSDKRELKKQIGHENKN